MASANAAKISTEIEMLSYSDRVFLLNKIIQSFDTAHAKKSRTASRDFEQAFGLWKDGNASIEEIRRKAWSRA